MTSYEAISQSEEVSQFADLETISGSHDNRVSPALKFVNNRLEERDMRGVFKIDPDFLRSPIFS
jgi:hypothetical protein